MSPASQGALEVERYIGSCLISSNVRTGLHGKAAICRKQEQSAIRGKSRGCYSNGQTYPLVTAGDQQCQVQYGPGGWTGAPLISMTSSPRRCNQRSSPSLAQQQQQQQQTCTDQQQQQQQQLPPAGHLHKSPLSRLAIHTQGAPLILAGRFYNRGKAHCNNNSSGSNNSGSPNGGANTLCGNIGNVAGNYVHNNANPSMTSNANSATRCSASRIVAQRPVEATPKKPTTTTNPKTAVSSECPSGAGKENANSSSIANIDSLSIASDESSGSNNSENSLPRIIKPRKRRKKDRKPLNVVASGVDAGKPEESQQRQQQQQQLSSSTSSSVCIATGAMEPNGVLMNAKSYVAGVPSCYEPRLYETPPPPHLRNYRRPPLGHRENAYAGCRAPLMQEAADMRQRYAHHRHAQVKVLDDNRNVVTTPMRGAAPPKGYRHYHVSSNVNANGNCSGNNNLSRRYAHEYGDVMTPATTVPCEVAARDGMGACQCRYCDPSGLIWDVDRNGYSPFLTATSGVEYSRGHFGQMPLFLTPPSLQQQQQQERALDRLFDEHPRPHDDVRDTGGVVLRRSWSDPTSYFSYEEIAAPARDVGVIGDRGQPDSSKRRTPWRGDSIGAPTSSSMSADPSGFNAAGVASPKGLEVSTEIITSPNGHRDLEIKFYSSPSPNAPVEREEDKSSSAGDDEDDDFSDIWSYHESKLQQDFRTLLQAEE